MQWREDQARVDFHGEVGLVLKADRDAVVIGGKTDVNPLDRQLARNKRRDNRNNRLLRSRGWQVFRVRECSISKRSSALFATLAVLNRRTGGQR